MTLKEKRSKKFAPKDLLRAMRRKRTKKLQKENARRKAVLERWNARAVS